jgi:intracellular septation protein A
MTAAVMMERIAGASPRLKAKIAGVFYLITFLTGGLALFIHGRLGFAAGLVAGACYIAVTLLFYFIFKPVNRSLSLLAAFFSLVGCAIGPLSLFVHAASYISPLVFFGFYCLLIGYLIFRSTFLPRILGALMAFAGLGWLTFLSPPLANYLSPWNMIPGILGEGMLTLWLLVKGVNAQRWKEQADAPRVSGA